MAAPQAHDPATKHKIGPESPESTEENQELAFGQVWKEATKSPLVRPSLADQVDGGRRKSSVQFNTFNAEDTIRRESVAQGPIPKLSISQRRMSSPPPPSQYQRGVSFDTFDNRDASTESFTLNYKHRDFAATTRSRTFLCGTDANDYSEYALEWMIEELVDDGDEIVCLRVVEKDSKIASDSSVERGKYREEAKKLLDSVIRKNSTEEKAISMIMELAVGKVQEIIQRMIQIYEPSALVVGTRGRNLGGMQGLLPGSVSKYCLQHSPVPVIVVRPTAKRMKKKAKRQLESGRSLYSSMLEKAQVSGGSHLYDKSVQDNMMLQEATKQEAAAVEKAIGAPRRGILKGNYGGPLDRVTSNRSDLTSDDDAESPEQTFALPIGFLSTEVAPRADIAMKSPSIAMLEENWDEELTPRRSRSPNLSPPGHQQRADSESAFSDTEDGMLGLPKIVEQRRPSMRETTPWLADILRDKPQRRSTSHNRSRSR